MITDFVVFFFPLKKNDQKFYNPHLQQILPTSLKMGVTKADKHCDLGCRFTESPDWDEEQKEKVLGEVLGIIDPTVCSHVACVTNL